jgi:hypothetical protein
MWRHFGGDDSAKTGEPGLEGQQAWLLGSEWPVCQGGYELRGPSDDGAPHFTSKYPLSRTDKWRTYYPLEDTPELFLSFARLYDKKEGIAVDAILNWVQRYGLLGYGSGRWSAGPEETLADYRSEVHRAAGILASYEAALNGDEEAARDAVLNEFLLIDRELWLMILQRLSDESNASLVEKLGNQNYATFLAKMVERNWGGSYLAYALDTALSLVNWNVRPECSPDLRLPGGASDPSEVSAGWAFKSLYGAMYLQMYWLMAAGGNVTRCKYCRRIISLASPLPGSRKTRQDKKFCNDACRQRHHYHTKTKPRRQQGELR